MKQKLIGLLAIMMVFCLTGCDWLLDDDIDYSVSANGTKDSVNSTLLTFTFDEEVEITANDITIINDSGHATKGSIQGSGKNYTLGITVQKAGDISVKINKTGIKSTAKNVTVHFATSSGGGTEPRTLTITGLTDLDAGDYYFEINLFESMEDASDYFNSISESASKLCILGTIDGNSIIEELGHIEYNEIDDTYTWIPFTGKAQYFISLTIAEMDGELLLWYDHVISNTLIDFNKDNITIDMDNFVPYDPYGGGGDEVTISGTIIKGSTQICEGYIIAVAEGFGSIGSAWFDFDNTYSGSENWEIDIENLLIGTPIYFMINILYTNDEGPVDNYGYFELHNFIYDGNPIPEIHLHLEDLIPTHG